MAFKKQEKASRVAAKRASSCLMRLTGGLRELYKNVEQSQRCSLSLHVEGSCTSRNGCFLPDKAPLLASRYRVIELIGNGSFGVVIQAVDTFHPDHCHVAIKVFDVNNSDLAYQEANYTRLLNRADPHDCVHIIRLLDMFSFDAHVCLVYELMSSLLLRHKIEIIPRTSEYKKKKLKIISKIAVQILVMLQFLYRMNVIHADLKPDNILLVKSTGSGAALKVTDFGNAIHCTPAEIDPYLEEFNLQSLWYRAPEVLLGVSVSLAIDMWSLGCILAELFIGQPLFSGRTREDIISGMISQLGDLPEIPFKEGKYSSLVGKRFAVSTLSQESMWFQTGEKLYAIFCKINKSGVAEREFASFLATLLCYSPDLRATPVEALQHPFLKLILPYRYLSDLHADYPVYNQFAQPPQEQTTLRSIERLGLSSLFRLNLLTPSKKPVEHLKPTIMSLMSSVTSLPHTEVTSSTPCATKFSVGGDVKGKPDLVEDYDCLLRDCGTVDGDTKDKPDLVEDCDPFSRDYDDVLIIGSTETNFTGAKATIALTQYDDGDPLPRKRKGKRENAVIVSSRRKILYGKDHLTIEYPSGMKVESNTKRTMGSGFLGAVDPSNSDDDQVSVSRRFHEECDVILF
ncbi:probable serine/threonine-protein kinase dyrk1 isoform X2 [Corticium candelabrum]|uniref:probable serine/threonine-protein kinase dyrk1 isoform X2 n=1 Tax=Corticium candelabrum TaxID=121492 RepID=UPI002E26463A|nr:probable serine/threonine-protein kinase dyrk1 isoform X2 [Corticium candelabrum]